MSQLYGGDIGTVPAAGVPVPRVRLSRPARAAVSAIEDARELDVLEPEWNALLEQSAASVFQSFEWQRTWWKHFGERRQDARLHVVTVRDDRQLVAVAPLYVEHVRRGSPLALRRLRFVGHHDSDSLDVLAARGRERESVELVAAHLWEHRELFDMVLLEDIPDRSATPALLHEAFRSFGWSASRSVDELCPRTTLRETFEDTLAAFPINYRREIRRRLRNIAKAFPVELEIVPPGDQIGPAMREFIDMHQERWVREGHPGAFADPRRVAFHCEVADRLSRRGWLFLAFLRVAGQRCAANYGFSFGDVLSTFLPGSREAPELAKYSPGRVLHARSMQWAIDRGKTVYDFMRGREHYKYEFGATDVPNWTVIAYPTGAAATAVRHRLDVVAQALRRRARREIDALLRVGRKHGWFSFALLEHLSAAFGKGLADVLVRLRGRRPEPRRG